MPCCFDNIKEILLPLLNYINAIFSHFLLTMTMDEAHLPYKNIIKLKIEPAAEVVLKGNLSIRNQLLP